MHAQVEANNLGGRQLPLSAAYEAHAAKRIAVERDKRGWSQHELARRMADVGVAIPQTAISKIETPQRGIRRAIGVDELIGFAQVFDLTLEAMLLPWGDDLVLESMVNKAAERLAELDECQLRYESTLGQVIEACIEENLVVPLLEQQAEAEARVKRVGPYARHKTQPKERLRSRVLTKIAEVLTANSAQLGRGES